MALPAGASEVTLTRERFDALQPETPPRAEASPGALVVERDVRLDPVGDERVDVVASWRVVVTRPIAVTLALAGPEVEVTRIEIDGRSVSVNRDPDGRTVLETLLTRSSRIGIVGSVRGDPGSGAQITLLEAGSGTVALPASFVAEGAVRIGPGRAIGAPAVIRLAPAPARSEQGTLVLGETALGLTVGEAEVRVRGRVRWRIARGSLDRVGFTLPDAGPDLTVTGSQVSSWTRDGDHVDVVLREPARSLVALELSYSGPVPTGETGSLRVPDLRADGVFRTTSTVQIARDGQIDVIPQLPGWQPTGGSSLPEWGRSLVEGVPTAAYVGQGGAGTVTLFRFTPADSPPTIVDVAAFTLATTTEGRVLMRAHYAVRNDRSAAMRITPPPGLVPIGVRVGGETANVARDGDVWLVPLEKSVETVEGLLSFPVEVNFLGEIGGWGRRERRAVTLPTVDAEVAVSRVTLYLPPGYRSRVRPGRGDAVEAFTEGQGITYGFAVGDVRAVQADALFQRAVDAWMGNEFDETTEILDQLEAMGAENADTKRLRANTYVLDQAQGEGEDVALERRVLEQARARSDADSRKQEEELERANQAYSSGDYEAAQESFEKALDLGEDLAKLQAKEDVSRAESNVYLRDKLEAVKEVSKQKAEAAASQMVTKAAEPLKTAPSSDTGVVARYRMDQHSEEPVTGTVVTEATGELQTVRETPVDATSPVVDEDEGWDHEYAASTEDRSQGEVLTKEFIQRIPVGRTYQSAVQSVPGSTGSRAGKGSKDMGPPPVTTPTAPAPLAVTAAGLSVVVPTIGAPVYYQRLLLPPGTVWEVLVEASETPGRRPAGRSP